MRQCSRSYHVPCFISGRTDSVPLCWVAPQHRDRQQRQLTPRDKMLQDLGLDGSTPVHAALTNIQAMQQQMSVFSAGQHGCCWTGCHQHTTSALPCIALQTARVYCAPSASELTELNIALDLAFSTTCCSSLLWQQVPTWQSAAPYLLRFMRPLPLLPCRQPRAGQGPERCRQPCLRITQVAQVTTERSAPVCAEGLTLLSFLLLL